jgi:hypothetical protein
MPNWLLTFQFLCNEYVYYYLTLGNMYSISETCSWRLFFGGRDLCIEQNVNWLSRNDVTMATAVLILVVTRAEMKKTALLWELDIYTLNCQFLYTDNLCTDMSVPSVTIRINWKMLHRIIPSTFIDHLQIKNLSLR